MQDSIKVIFIEDEEVWQQAFQLHLSELGFDVVGSTDNVQDALQLFNGNNYDIALLDVNLHGKNNGIELGKMLSTVYNKPFIFITGSQDTHTIEQAIQANPSAYLLKPVTKIALLAAIQNAIHNFETKQQAAVNKTEGMNEFVFVKVGNKYKKIYWDQVESLKADGNYTKLFHILDKSEYFIRSTMPQTIKYFVPDVTKAKFAQINRAEMVNINFIEEITGNTIVTKHNKFECSESQGKELRKKINII